MTATRAISKTSPVNGAVFTANMADTVNTMFGYLAGVAVTPAGTNAYTFTLEITTGFTGPTDGMTVSVKIPNTNTGAVTFNVASTGAKAVVQANGDAFVGGEIEGGTVYTFVFLESDDEWRIQSIGSGSSSSGSGLPFTRFELFTTTGAWSFTAPYDCDVMVIAQGAGGSGGATEGSTNRRASGGGAGSQAVAQRAMSSGDEISGVVGAGGAAAVATSVSDNGNAGGTTTVTSSDISIAISAAGGDGGEAGGAVTMTGGVGGTATGGDRNYSGGAAGDVTGGAPSQSGGGAPPFFADGVDADDQTTTGAGLGAEAATDVVGNPYLNPASIPDGGDALSTTGNSTLDAVGRGAGSGGVHRTDSGTRNGYPGGDGWVLVWYTEATS